MVTRQDISTLVDSLANLPASDEPLKKSGVNTMGKMKAESGVANFNNTKNATVVFASTFNRVPLIQLTMGDTGLSPVYKSSVTLTSLTMKFQSNWSGNVDWVATERP